MPNPTAIEQQHMHIYCFEFGGQPDWSSEEPVIESDHRILARVVSGDVIPQFDGPIH